MAHCYNYAIVRFQAHPARNESLNIGIIIFHNSGVDVRPAKNLDKIRALSGAIDQELIRESLINLENIDRTFCIKDGLTDADRLEAINSISPLDFSGIGRFEAYSSVVYDQVITRLMANLVEPEIAPLKKIVRRSRLLTSVKSALKYERVLAKRGEDISAHRVVSDWPLAEGLSADLALQNGKMHIFETIDAQSDDVSLRKLISNIGVSALVLEQARITYGSNETNSRLIYTASAHNEFILKPALHAAEHQGAKLINWASQDDRNSLLIEITKLATAFENPRKVVGMKNINASTQQRFLLN